MLYTITISMLGSLLITVILIFLIKMTYSHAAIKMPSSERQVGISWTM